MRILKSWQAELFLLFMTFIWGGTFLFTKLGIKDCPPSLYIIFRFSIALIISFSIFGKYLFRIKKEQLLHGLVLGLLFGSGFILQTYGLKFTTITKSAFITGIAVVMTPFAYWFVERKRIRIWSKIGVFIAAIGLWIFTNPKFDNINLGDVLTLLSTAFWAFYITYMDVFTRFVFKFEQTAQLVIMQYIAATPIAVLTFFAFDINEIQVYFSKNLIISLIYNGIFASFFLTWIHTSVQKFTTPVKAALIFSLEPIVASLVAYYAQNELMGFLGIIGAIILMLGVVVSEFGEYIVKSK